MTKRFQSAFHLLDGCCAPMRFSKFIEWGKAANGEMGILQFTSKSPFKYENMFYFCGGYIDQRTRRYYVCPQRVDAFFPLFTLDEIVPERCAIDPGTLIEILNAFDESSTSTFEPEFRDTRIPSIVTQVNIIDDLLNIVDSMVDKRRQLGVLRKAIAPYRSQEPIPKETIFNYWKFCDALDYAEAEWSRFVTHWTMLDMQAHYDNKVNKKLISVFDFPLYEKVIGRLDYADKDLLRDLFRRQRDGSLEDDVEEDDILLDVNED